MLTAAETNGIVFFSTINSGLMEVNLIIFSRCWLADPLDDAPYSLGRSLNSAQFLRNAPLKSSFYRKVAPLWCFYGFGVYFIVKALTLHWDVWLLSQVLDESMYVLIAAWLQMNIIKWQRFLFLHQLLQLKCQFVLFQGLKKKSFVSLFLPFRYWNVSANLFFLMNSIGLKVTSR